MPSKTEKQRRFFGAVMSAKKGGKASGKAKKVASQMSKGQIKDFLHKEEQSKFDSFVNSILNE